MKNLLLLATLLFTISACDSTTVTPVVATTITNLDADVNKSGHYTFFDLKNNQVVALADSATTKWDIAFKATSIIINSGVSGMGNAEAQVVDGIFSELTEAPATGYQKDIAANNLAIKPGSGAGWYNYNPTAMVITPIPGKIIVVKTTNGRYAKIQIKNYYKDAPATPTVASPSRYFTFDYIYQPNESTKFTN